MGKDREPPRVDAPQATASREIPLRPSTADCPQRGVDGGKLHCHCEVSERRKRFAPQTKAEGTTVMATAAASAAAQESLAPVDGATLLLTGLLGVLVLVYLLNAATQGLGGPASVADVLAVLRQGVRDPRRAELRERALREAEDAEAERVLHHEEVDHLERDVEDDDLSDDDEDDLDDADLGFVDNGDDEIAAAALDENAQDVDGEAPAGAEPDFDNMTERQMQKAMRKRRKRDEKRARQEWIRERERRRQAEREAYLARQQERDEEHELEAAAQRETLEEKRKEDEALYKQWRGAITVERQGEDAGDADDQVAATIVKYIKENKVVRLEDLAADMELRTQDVKQRLEAIVAEGRIDGVFDDRGKFIHVTTQELDALAQYITERGRVSIRELTQAQLVSTTAASTEAEAYADPSGATSTSAWTTTSMFGISGVVAAANSVAVASTARANTNRIFPFPSLRSRTHVSFAQLIHEIIQKHGKRIDEVVRPERDFDYDIFSIQTLRKSYLLRKDGVIMETPQYMHMRVALGIHGDDLESAFAMYDKMSRRLYTPASPTLFNSGTPRAQLASCFLLALKGDSIEGIFDTLGDCAKISKYAGGIGLHMHNLRSSNSHIEGTNGKSSGIVPFLKIFNETARAVNQAGKRKGAFAIYLEPHHADIEQFIELRRNTGAEELRTHDLFMERVQQNALWSLFDPNTAPGLEEVYGDEYKALYERYETEGRAVKTVRAQDLWVSMLRSIKESGGPYLTNKDAVNNRSNKKNLGTIKSSNLCNEIVEYSSPDESAVCTLSSLILANYVTEEVDDTFGFRFNFEMLTEVTREVVRNLDLCIDRMFYPIESARTSNLRHRPMGIGVSGLHDVFMKLKMAYDSPEAKQLNKLIFETIYRAAVLESSELARVKGPYESFAGSPASQGVFQFEMWGLDVTTEGELFYKDWEGIHKNMVRYGLRNSLLVALMPTASSASIAGVTESFEILTSNLYSRKVMAGEYTIVNKYMVRELVERGIWNQNLSERILSNNGSIQVFADEIPADVRHRYRTVWEYKMRDYIVMSADRAPFVCQTQSLNLYMVRPTIPKLNAMLQYAHKKGLKTLLYYLRTKAVTEAIKFTAPEGMHHIIDENENKNENKVSENEKAILADNDDRECLSCSA
ncbi:Ribonucleoside-diphosphate reductase large subunit [Hondaea fermentalgiana]|uniref:Ribonucleoside-diphosphate reductase n=1 Tax=Hondaea fermentalgiana TaxID=2315210 RepID=A0A2R5GTZ7_9STRA|nr:Ribonucleoside-diphosphate reductase large subunit [Hondaea fermentalgiana]|eukprot:GBG33228.1 Ribonucleoside-diphosphate reductase large subunit [Hondaea fermentalgiana]